MKLFLQKGLFQIGLVKFLWLMKVKNTAQWSYVISNLNIEEIAGTFYEKELRKSSQKEFRV